MSKKIVSLAANNNLRGYFDGYTGSEHRQIVEKTFDWSVNYLANLGLFDEVYLFTDSDYNDTSLIQNKTHTKVNIIPARGRYFLRCHDEMIHENTGLRLNEDDYLFSTHMDAYISKQHLNQMLSDADNHGLVGGTNNYHHNCLPVALDGKKVPWWADQYLICQVGWMRKYGLSFTWQPCTRAIQHIYLQFAGCPVAIKGQNFVPLNDPSTEFPSEGKGLSFDGFQEASLRIAIYQKQGVLPSCDLKEYPDGNRADRDMMHLKSFFMQSETTWKGTSNNMIINTVILGRPPEKERFKGTEGKSYGHNPRLELEEIRGTSLYADVWNETERERFESLLRNEEQQVNLYVYENNPQNLSSSIVSQDKLKKAFSYNVVKQSVPISPEKAQFFVVPVLFLLDDFNRLENNAEAMKVFCESLPYWKGNEDRHIFLDQSDHCQKPSVIEQSLIFTVTPKASDPTHRALPFFPYRHDSLDVPRLLDKDITKAEFDLFFKGCDSSMPIRKTMLDLSPVYEESGLKTYIQTYGKYFWNRELTEENKTVERQHYFERLTDSKFVLCPRGAGTTSSRFFETLYFGRIPVLISDDIRLPLENKIDWSELVVRVKEDGMEDLPLKVKEFAATNNLTEIKKKIIDISHKYFIRDAILQLIQETLG